MEGSEPGWYWIISWTFLCPVALLTIIIATLVSTCTTKLQYDWAPLRNKEAEHLPAKIDYPAWAIVLIVILIIAAVICIPLFAVLYWRKIYDPRKLGGVKETDQTNVTESTIPLTEKS